MQQGREGREKKEKNPNRLNKQHGRESSLLCKEYLELRHLNEMLKAQVEFPAEDTSTKAKQAPRSALRAHMIPIVKAEPLHWLLLFYTVNVYKAVAF